MLRIAELILIAAVISAAACDGDMRRSDADGGDADVRTEAERGDVRADSERAYAGAEHESASIHADSDGAPVDADRDVRTDADRDVRTDAEGDVRTDPDGDVRTDPDGKGALDEPAVLTTPDTSEFRDERLALVRRHIAARGIEDPRVLEALRSVPRHRFVPKNYAEHAYANRPLPIGHGQTISQPYIVAYMTDLVEADPSDRVLEVGTGSGYQAAVLAEIVDEVYTVEIIAELARTAQERLQRLGYHNVHVKHADGYFGWEEHAPFDAIVVTAAAEHIPPPLIDQLRDGGRMIIPVGSPFRTQSLMLVEKEGDELSTRSLAPVRFVPFTRDN